MSLDKFIATDPPLVKYDEKFIFYHDIIKQLTGEKDYVDIGPLRLNKRPLLNQICEHADQWKKMLGEKLTIKTRDDMMEFKAQIEVNTTA